MIPQAYITAWRKKAPWQEDFQVEQDLVIERALMAIYSNEYLKERLAFRGGTALHKLYLSPAARYSEDIDLVQITAEPFGSIMDKLRETLSFLGDKPIRKQKQHNITLVYRFDSEGGIPLRLKVEVNCREHHTIFGIQDVKHTMQSEWFTGEVLIPSYQLPELLGTKMRALYQRRKGRDLFDMWFALIQGKVDPRAVIEAWNFYMKEEHNGVTQKEFLENMEKKIEDADFTGDMNGLLRSDIQYNISEAYKFVRTNLLEKI
ncbi:nucleotidyl transferase AbiEii/AbiGii toxin family protein [Panacibacter sp. DH6]|uniref:Nucleotidyl transferase AbiEii/AbiGii toxin family protein n=1 Tax=Panacibacter microcysteis TaxID=2793269 RepID=A0A931E9U5_9BACT|nr:nucleotidyl transferase AbiEii/AbiGii toxin family protein [Panacibacter microcysteis]MBG9376809.1 nucleotidyl transferase AbiEii/AbiGii toxin family protein [Panacibacter microcysteis]